MFTSRERLSSLVKLLFAAMFFMSTILPTAAMPRSIAEDAVVAQSVDEHHDAAHHLSCSARHQGEISLDCVNHFGVAGNGSGDDDCCSGTCISGAILDSVWSVIGSPSDRIQDDLSSRHIPHDLAVAHRPPKS